MTYKIPRKNKPMKTAYSVPTKKKDEKKVFLEDIKRRGTITEREILLIKRRLNNGTYKWDDVNELYDLKITPEQSQKGLSWLKNKGWTPRGIERKNNPYGYREEEAIKSFKYFTFDGFHNDNTYFQSQHNINNFVPIYSVVGEKGSFQYYVKLGQPYIIG